MGHEDVVLGVVVEMIHDQIDPGSMHGMRGYPLDSYVELLFAEGLQALSDASSPIAVFLIYFFDFCAGCSTDSVNGFEHSLFDRPDFTTAGCNVFLNEIVQFPLRPQTELNKLLEALTVVLRCQEFEIGS